MNNNLNHIRHLQGFKAPLLPPILIATLPLVGMVGMAYTDSFLVLIICCMVSAVQYRTWRRHQRAQYIQHYPIPRHVLHQLRRDYMLNSEQLPIIERGFKDFCLIHLARPNQLHNMPSKAVDALWHGFILDTRSYAAFCQRAFGKMLHHQPASNMHTLPITKQQQALKATWRAACQLENIPAQAAHCLPFLFCLDQYLAWSEGRHYQLDQLNQLLRYADETAHTLDVELACSLDLSDQGSDSDSSGDSSDGGCSSCGD